MTLTQIASAISNNVMSGLRATTNVVFSIEQLEGEIISTGPALILQLSGKMKFKPDEFAQTTKVITLDNNTLPAGAYANQYISVAHATIPRISSTFENKSVIYAGPADMSLNMIKYFDNAYTQHKYSFVIADRPYVYIDTSIKKDGIMDIYFFNTGTLDKVIVKAVFEDPLAIYGGSLLAAELVEFPVPQFLQNMIIDTLTNKYIEYYRKLNQGYQPNTQTQLT